jgi:hypothetical protein
VPNQTYIQLLLWYKVGMTEIVEPGVLAQGPKRRKLKLKASDIVIFGIIILAIVGLSMFTVNKLKLKNDVSAAQTVSDKAIDDLQKRDGAAARQLGSKTFQKAYTASQLTKQFKAVEVATLKPPKLDRTTAYDGNKGRTIFFIYKYTALKVPFYVRTAVAKSDGAWHMTQISGSADESTLVVQ